MIFGIISMMLLGIVDMYFIGLLGTTALAAAGFALPITSMVISVALGIGMGQSALTSRLVGEGRHGDAARFLSDAQMLVVGIAIALAVIGVLTIEPLFSVMGADRETLVLIKRYMVTWYWGSPLLMLTFLSTNAMRAVGDTRTSALLSAQLSLTNLIFDPILIFGIGPVPAFGIRGAALATVLAGLTTWLTAFAVLAVRERLLDFRPPRWTHLKANWRRLMTIGVPAVGANLMTPLAATAMTAIIAAYGAAAVAGFGVGARVESLALIIVFAMSSSLPMFIGQNIGAGKPQRAYRALMGCLKFTVAVQALVYVALVVAAPLIASAFSADPLVRQVIVTFLWVLPLSYGAHGIVILSMVSLNVLQRPRTALALTIIRLVVLYVPLAYAGGKIAGFQGMFVGAALGNVVAAGWTLAIMRGVCRAQGLAATTPDRVAAAPGS